MSLTFETLGNATIQFMADGMPLLATDPWLKGTCYFGSWSLDHALTDQQIRNVQQSQYIWISHGHPDHLHHESLEIIPRSAKLLIPDHYSRDIYDFLIGLGFDVEILRYRVWVRLHAELEVLCIDNENQDSMLIARFGNALILNLNDSPFFGEQRFLKNIIKRHPNDRVFVLQLCSIDADMRNFVDETGQRTIPQPEELKPGAVRAVARDVRKLGAKFFCCSSSQHLYIRSDTVWANPYRITFADMQRSWNQRKVELVPPFVTVDLLAGTCTENHPSRLSDISQITSLTGEDDWDERLSEAEKAKVAEFFRTFRLLGRYLDFVEVVVAGERVRIKLGRPSASHWRRPRGATFFAPRKSLLEAVEGGYFDDLLIGNFMKTQLHGDASLYPFVTPIIAKIGGNAKVFDRADYLRFRLHYLRRNPAGFLRWRLRRWIDYSFVPWVRVWAARLQVFQPLKQFYRQRLLHDVAAGEGGLEFSNRVSKTKTARTWVPALTREGKLAPARPDLDGIGRPRLIISVDTEEDFDWRGPFLRGATAVDSIARQEAAQQLIERHGATPIYLCDFPVAAQEKAYRQLREWHAAGRCMIGAHLHPWVNPPQVEAVTSINSYPCNLPLELQREKLHILTETITANIGVRPDVYKAGRYGGDLHLPALLKPLGYRIDMSINPIGNYSADGGPNQTMFPYAPFWLDPEQELLAIPATGNVLGALRGRWVAMAGAVRKDTSDRIKLGWLLRHLGLINRVFLSPEGTPLDEAKALTRLLVAAGHRVFTLGYHSTSLNPGSNPYVRDAAELRRFLGWLDAYLDFFFGEIGGAATLPTEIYSSASSAPVTQAALG
jgi:hypothetical protein